MNLILDPIEARVLGCLIEKERTTPEYYPLTLNALVSACNQKNNREPLMQVDEQAVTRALDTLRVKGLTCLRHTAGGRVPKNAHRIEQFFELSAQEYSILCVLLLRGPQTAGEIRTRTGRMCEFQSPAEVETILQELATRADGPFVVKLPREPGRSASRYAHLFCGPVEAGEIAQTPVPAPTTSPTPTPPAPDRLAALEQQVAELRTDVDRLKSELGISDAESA